MLKLSLQPFVDRLISHSRLSDIEQRAILGLPTEVVRAKVHTDVVRLRETVEHAIVVVEGVVGRFGQNATGERQIVGLHVAGDTPDLHLVVVPRNSAPIQALSAATLLRVPHSALRAVAARYPAIAEAFWRNCSLDAAITAQWVINIGRRNARSRIAHLLCEMGARLHVDTEAGAVTFPFPLTHIHLSDATGVTPVHISRTVSALKEEGLVILSERTAQIPDWGRLVEAAQFDAGYLQTCLRSGESLRIVD